MLSIPGVLVSDEFVRRSELDEIIRSAVRRTLDEYEHICILNLKAGHVDHVRDLVNAVSEVGDGDIAKGIVAVRDNHKFVMQCHAAAAKIGWGVIIATMVVLGTLGVVAASLWNSLPKGGSA